MLAIPRWPPHGRTQAALLGIIVHQLRIYPTFEDCELGVHNDSKWSWVFGSWVYTSAATPCCDFMIARGDIEQPRMRE